MKRRKRVSGLFLLAVPLVLAGCGGEQNPLRFHAHTTTANTRLNVFFNGVWDGLTAIISFVAELFHPVRWGIYDVGVNSNFYDIGWMIGFALALTILTRVIIIVWP